MLKDIVGDLLKDMSLKSRLKVDFEMTFITLLSELGYREDKMWTEDEDEILSKLVGLAEEAAESTIKTFQRWEEDGRPGVKNT